MKHSKSIYPIGATWECIHSDGRIGTITLSQRSNGIEMWTYSSLYKDGSLDKSDWTTSKRLARQCHPFGSTYKFKRVKP